MAKDESPILHLRITPDDQKRIDSLSRKLPDFNRAVLTRQALRVGLAEIERDHSRVVVKS